MGAWRERESERAGPNLNLERESHRGQFKSVRARTGIVAARGGGRQSSNAEETSTSNVLFFSFSFCPTGADYLRGWRPQHHGQAISENTPVTMTDPLQLFHFTFHNIIIIPLLFIPQNLQTTSHLTERPNEPTHHPSPQPEFPTPLLLPYLPLLQEETHPQIVQQPVPDLEPIPCCPVYGSRSDEGAEGIEAELVIQTNPANISKGTLRKGRQERRGGRGEGDRPGSCKHQHRRLRRGFRELR